MDFINLNQDQRERYIAEIAYIKQISESIAAASEYVQNNQESLRKFYRRDMLVMWLKEQLRESLQLLSSLHAPDLSKFPNQECDGAALLKIFSYPPECAIISSCGNIPSEQGIPTKPCKVNFTPETKTIKNLIRCTDHAFSYPSVKHKDEYIHSIDGQPIKYKNQPKSVLLIPIYSYKTVFGLLYFHSSQERWFTLCNGFHFLILGNKLGRFFQYMPTWLEDVLCG